MGRAKDLADFQSTGTPFNQTLVDDLATGGFIAQQRNVVPVGGTGAGKTHRKLHPIRCSRALLQFGLW
nr:ATP-binding protein [Bradyrhizobium sp. 2S1]